MSQYPPPYQQPPYPGQGPFDYYRQASNPLGPARRASVLMFVLGGFGLLCGAFMTLIGAIMTPQMIAEAPNSAQLHEFETRLGGIPLRGMMIAMGILCLLPSILYGILGFFVRSGKMVPIVISTVLAGISLVLIFIQLLGGIAQGASDPATLGAAICMMGIPLVLCIMLLIWLIQALRAAPAVAAMQQQFQAQYWQSMQQQQAAQLGYGYGMPPGYGYAAPPNQPPAPPGQAPVDYQAPLMPPPPPPAPEYPREADENSQNRG